MSCESQGDGLGLEKKKKKGTSSSQQWFNLMRNCNTTGFLMILKYQVLCKLVHAHLAGSTVILYHKTLWAVQKCSKVTDKVAENVYKPKLLAAMMPCNMYKHRKYYKQPPPTASVPAFLVLENEY